MIGKLKLFIFLSALLMLLVACSNSNDEQNTQPPPKKPKQEKFVSDADYGEAEEALMPDTFKHIIYNFEKGCDKGITQSGWDEFNKEAIELWSNVCDGEITKEIAYDYYEFHWKAFDLPTNKNHHVLMYPYMSEPLQFVMFDTRFNTGDGSDETTYANGALRMLQEVLNEGPDAPNLKVDGGWGSETFKAFQEAVKNGGEEAHMEIAFKLLEKREKMHCLRAIEDGGGFLTSIDGFLNRIETIRVMLNSEEEIKQVEYIEKFGESKDKKDGESYCKEKFGSQI